MYAMNAEEISRHCGGLSFFYDYRVSINGSVLVNPDYILTFGRWFFVEERKSWVACNTFDVYIYVCFMRESRERMYFTWRILSAK